MASDGSGHDRLSQLRSEVGRLEKIVAALIGRAEAASDQLPTDFGVFQTTVLLEDQVRTRTSELNAAMKLLEESNRALHDSRAKFQAMALARRTGSALALGYLDLDGFKMINDQYGHQAGDRVLVEMARRLKSVIRASDTAGRLGGDEFAVVLQGNAGGESFDEVLARILEAIRMPCPLAPGVVGRIGASIGFTVFPEDDGTPLMLLEHADQAMYLAKRDGKNCCRRFAPSPCAREG
jgi:diguanylate cyclase (GGDEF)-like protein